MSITRENQQALLLRLARQEMVRRGLEPDFPAAVLAEVERQVAPGSPFEDGVRDLRDLGWCSIDNDTSRDLDQLTAASELPGGGATVMVAVADVSVLAADPLRFPDLSLSVIKLMGRGKYVASFPGADVTGHFGLAVSDYTHSTAPNRRFPDLITQRLLKAAQAGQPAPYAREPLEALAAHCTRKEDDARKVERLLRKAAAACLLDGQTGRG